MIIAWLKNLFYKNKNRLDRVTATIDDEELVLDRELVNILLDLNKAGLRTSDSCQGRLDPNEEHCEHFLYAYLFLKDGSQFPDWFILECLDKGMVMHGRYFVKTHIGGGKTIDEICESNKELISLLKKLAHSLR